jgi:general secretion pathway protein L
MSPEKEMTERKSWLLTAVAAVQEFFRWWLSEMVTLLPANVKRFMRQRGHRLVIDFTANNIEIIECRGQHENDLGQYALEQNGSVLPEVVRPQLDELDMDGTEVVIRLPENKVLCKTLTLPLEAEENLREVLGYEMDRQTPFKAEQVYYDYQVTARQSELGQLTVQMIVVPRGLLERIVSTAVEWGFPPDIVTATSATGPHSDHCVISGFNLLPKERRHTISSSWNLLNRLLAISVATLLVVVVTQPLVIQKGTIDSLEQQVAAIKEEAEAAQALGDEASKMITESRLFVEEKRKLPSVIEVLNELSLILPDDTWLQRLEMKNGKVTIQGISSEASALIELIETSSFFQNATFQSPIVQDPRSGRYRFQIVADVLGEAQHEA